MTTINNNEHSIFKMIVLSIKHFKMFNFMCSLLILLVLLALLENHKYAVAIIKALSIVVFIAGVYVASANKKSLIILSILAVPWLFSELIISSNKTVFLSFFFFLYITMVLLEKIIKTKNITLDTLFAAVCVYLLLGLLWASIYGLINELVPGGVLTGGINSETPTANEVIYFSYTTLTTLGYGDIVSVTPVGRIMSALEAIVGHLYIALLVARIVSIFSSKSYQ